MKLYPSDKGKESYSHLESDLFKFLNIKQKLNGNLRERHSGVSRSYEILLEVCMRERREGTAELEGPALPLHAALGGLSGTYLQMGS